jgi:hypothetical protein
MNTVRPWKTVNVVPLAGTWCNRFRTKAGKAIQDPCPAILVQSRGNETRTAFATYNKGVLFAACDMPGYEESSCAGGPRANPYRPGQPPWLMLDEIDPAQKVADDIAASVPLSSFFTRNLGEETPAN